MNLRISSLSLVCLPCLSVLLHGCALSHALVEPVDPTIAVAEVRAALETLAVAGDPEAAGEAWRLAYARFEGGLEAPLREGCGERSVVELEYAFGRVGATMASGETSASVAALLVALDERLPCLPAAALL